MPCTGLCISYVDCTVLILIHRWVLTALQPQVSLHKRQLRMASVGGHGNELRRIQCSQRLADVREGARDGAQNIKYLSSVCICVRWHRWGAEDMCVFALLPPRDSVVSLRQQGLDGCAPHCWAVWPVPVRIFNMLFIPWRSTRVTIDMWRAEDRLQELILSFQHMDSWPKTSWFYILAM